MPNIFPNKFARGFIIAVDLFIIIVAYVLAFTVRYEQIAPRNIEAFMSVIPWILLISVLFICIYEVDRLVQYDVWDIVRKLAVSLTFIMLLTMTASFLFREFGLPRLVIILAHIFAFTMLLIWKVLYTKYNQLSRKGKLMFIGDESEFDEIEDNLSKFLSHNGNVKYFDKKSNVQQLKAQLLNYNFIFLSNSLEEDKKNRLIFHAMKNNKLVYVVPTVNDLLVMNTAVTTLDDTMVMQVKPFTLPLAQLAMKRLTDIVFSLAILIFTLPVFLITALSIKLEDGGSIFFKQERIGKDHKQFHILKFRSMVENAEAKTGPTLAQSGDRRITKIGKFIRKTRIDELPQLINVLIGDMSLVGPRPERDFFADQFQKDNKWFNYRNTVKPGITGYAQVMGKYTTNVDKKLKFDLHYIRNYSLWLDYIILLRTVLVVINKAKSEGEVKPAKKIRMFSKKQEDYR
ncbi:sugar transferase [Alkalicoccobacillus porphyridii]|uniref:sugar transferase n=1 Tax=Alkalicoccobacillus porphyridii TaxID=2597270 RepID=UPI001C8F32EE|nr:sugar transferase [Alkalicoccobacillus porphyridii]